MTGSEAQVGVMVPRRRKKKDAWMLQLKGADFAVGDPIAVPTDNASGSAKRKKARIRRLKVEAADIGAVDPTPVPRKHRSVINKKLFVGSPPSTSAGTSQVICDECRGGTLPDSLSKDEKDVIEALLLLSRGAPWCAAADIHVLTSESLGEEGTGGTKAEDAPGGQDGSSVGIDCHARPDEAEQTERGIYKPFSNENSPPATDELQAGSEFMANNRAATVKAIHRQPLLLDCHLVRRFSRCATHVYLCHFTQRCQNKGKHISHLTPASLTPNQGKSAEVGVLVNLSNGSSVDADIGSGRLYWLQGNDPRPISAFPTESRRQQKDNVLFTPPPSGFTPRERKLSETHHFPYMRLQQPQHSPSISPTRKSLTPQAATAALLRCRSTWTDQATPLHSLAKCQRR